MTPADLSWIMSGDQWRQLSYYERRQHWIRLNAFFRSESRRRNNENPNPDKDWFDAEDQFYWVIRRNPHLLN